MIEKEVENKHTKEKQEFIPTTLMQKEHFRHICYVNNKFRMPV
jgi:hypothetical protein